MQSRGHKPLSSFVFSEVFEEMKVSVLSLKKDKCDTCHGHEVGLITEEDWELHRSAKEREREEMNNDVAFAKQYECKMFTMNLEAVKVCPFVQVNTIFYETRLCCHNFTVLENATKSTTCFWFSETAADMSESTFATCILGFLQVNYREGVGLPIILFSDGCTYQNRNNILSNALLQYSTEYNVEIVQKFLIVSHTQITCDSVHAKIETYVKQKDIYLPNDYVRFSKECQKIHFLTMSKRWSMTIFVSIVCLSTNDTHRFGR